MSVNAYELLKSEIVSGKRKPGEIFEEKRFAAQLGVSRTPVREAVLRLAREGLLVVMPRRGTVISNISMEDIRQLYESGRAGRCGGHTAAVPPCGCGAALP